MFLYIKKNLNILTKTTLVGWSLINGTVTLTRCQRRVVFASLTGLWGLAQTGLFYMQHTTNKSSATSFMFPQYGLMSEKPWVLFTLVNMCETIPSVQLVSTPLDILLVSVFPAGYAVLPPVFSPWYDMSYSGLGRQSPVFIPQCTQPAWHIKDDNLREKKYLWLVLSQWKPIYFRKNLVATPYLLMFLVCYMLRPMSFMCLFLPLRPQHTSHPHYFYSFSNI